MTTQISYTGDKWHVGTNNPVGKEYYNDLVSRKTRLERMRSNGEVAFNSMANDASVKKQVFGGSSAYLPYHERYDGQRTLNTNQLLNKSAKAYQQQMKEDEKAIIRNSELTTSKAGIDKLQPRRPAQIYSQDNLYKVYEQYIDNIKLGGMRDKTPRYPCEKYMKV